VCHKKIILSLSSLEFVEIDFSLAFVSVLKRLFLDSRQIADGMLISQSTIDAVKSLAFINIPY